MTRKTNGAQPRARGAGRKARTTRGPGGAFRQEILEMHQSIFRQNQTRINESVFGYTKAFQRYEREYTKGVTEYERRAKLEDLDRALARANIAYVGDYHTLAQAQRSFLRLLRRLPKERPCTVALELVQGRHQRHLDAYMNGQLAEEAFLQAIEHRAHWVFGGWENFREILALTRRRGWRAIGIDTAGHGPAGASLATRDRYAARRLARAIDEAPQDHLVMVLIGELHIAPKHLPAEVQAALAQRQTESPRSLIIYQNCHEIYWQLEARGLEHEVELVRVAKDRYCVINTPPIVCQQSFLNWLEVDDMMPQIEAPEESFREYARLIAAFFDLPLGDEVDEVEIVTVGDLSFLARLRRRGDFSTSDMQQIRRQILRSESYFIPRANMVYLGNLSVNHAAEEATHFLRHLCSKAGEPRLLVDAFYARCIEEALGFLGSKLINHKRKCTPMALFERAARSRNNPEMKKLGRLVLKHVRLEQGKRVRKMNEVYECDIDTFNALTHTLGYRLGERLYYALLDGTVDKTDIRELFFDPLEEESSPLTTYLYLVTVTANTKVPERF